MVVNNPYENSKWKRSIFASTNKNDGIGCKVNFQRAILRVFSELSTNTTLIEVKEHGTDTWIKCIEYK